MERWNIGRKGEGNGWDKGKGGKESKIGKGGVGRKWSRRENRRFVLICRGENISMIWNYEVPVHVCGGIWQFIARETVDLLSHLHNYYMK